MMQPKNHVWAVVLAAGDGRRLRGLTIDATGRQTPKQYCSLFGGPTLLQEAMKRGRAVAGRDRLCAIVAAQHAEWWRGPLWSLQSGNLLAQPQNRGTANGVLLCLLSILARDPAARLVFLPADHYVADEVGLRGALRSALNEVERAPEALVLVGVKPGDADPELGYIVPAPGLGNSRRVSHFVEKPSPSVADTLCRNGALWNSFIFCVAANTLLALLRAQMADAVDQMETALAQTWALELGPGALESLYATLPDVDLSRDVLTKSTARLRVVTAPPCGWTDLGTPRHVAEVVLRAGHRARDHWESAEDEGMPILAAMCRRSRNTGTVTLGEGA